MYLKKKIFILEQYRQTDEQSALISFISIGCIEKGLNSKCESLKGEKGWSDNEKGKGRKLLT